MQAAESTTTEAQATSTDSVGTTAPKGAKAAKAASKRPSKAKVTKPAAKAVKPTKKAPKTTKKASAKKPKAITGDRIVPADLSQYHVDKEKKTANGNNSVDCADEVATLLRGKELDKVYDLVAKKVDETVQSLKARYKHLNPGMQRMNLGNKLRGVLNAK